MRYAVLTSGWWPVRLRVGPPVTPMASPVGEDLAAEVSDLTISIVEVKSRCPVYRRGDRFYIRDGFKLVADRPLCMHALQALTLYYVALSRGVVPTDLCLAGPDGAAYVQRLDPQRYTGGGTVTFCIERLRTHEERQ
jgi:uncharacterized repeat protein (TIGR04076 family)